jgi:hypothetical protein
MSTDRDITRIVRSWLDEGATALPDRVLDAVLDQVPVTPQRRPRWPARRFRVMNNSLKFALVAAAVVVIVLVGINLLPRSGGVGGTGPSPISPPTQTPTSAPTPTPSAVPTGSPARIPDGPLKAGTYVTAPFAQAGSDACGIPPQSGCIDSTNDDSIRVTFTVPDGWAGIGGNAIWLANEQNASPGGASLIFVRGAWLLTDPCQNGQNPDIPVGPTVADFVGAVAKHPLLDTTTPVDVKLAGYSGKYFDLQVPADIFNCDDYRPWEPGLYAQGPSHRWHLSVLDVDGVRVVVQSMDYAGTSATRRAELKAIVDSIKIES